MAERTASSISRAGSTKVVYAALIGNLLIAATKFTAAALTGSSAMLSEGVHSVVDTGNEGLLLYGMRRSSASADVLHPFGHGKEVYFWSFVVALLVFALGSGVSLYEGVQHLRHPTPLTDAYVNYVVLGVSALLEGASWLVAFRAFRRKQGDNGAVEAVNRTKNPTDFVVLLEDSAALAGIAAAFVGVLLGDITGNPVYDGVASLVIGSILAGTAFWLARETKGLLIGESASREVVASIRRIVEALPGVQSVNEVLTMHMGPDFILANISIVMAPNVDAQGSLALQRRMEREIKSANARVKRIFIEQTVLE